jgi:hypothetical protein
MDASVKLRLSCLAEFLAAHGSHSLDGICVVVPDISVEALSRSERHNKAAPLIPHCYQ